MSEELKKDNAIKNQSTVDTVDSYDQINESTNKQLTPSAPQQINESTNKQINPSAPQQINKSTNQQINPSAPQQINESTNQQLNSSWDLEIKPQSHLLDINFKDLWRYRDLLWMFVKRDFTAQYKQTILGPLWHFIQPLFTTIVFLVVFTNIAKIPTDGVPPVLFYMSGITIWNYFSSCLTATSNTFVANAGIFGKVYFPRLIMPLSIVTSNVVKFGIQFLLLIMVIVWYFLNNSTSSTSSTLSTFSTSSTSSTLSTFSTSSTLSTFSTLSTSSTFSTLLLIPLLILIMAGLGLGLGIIISSMTTKYRDLTVLIGFAVQLLMYATPVVYPLSAITDEGLKFWIKLNPLTPLIEAFRYAMLGAGSFDTSGILYSIGFMLVTLFLGLLIFSKVERTFMDTV